MDRSRSLAPARPLLLALLAALSLSTPAAAQQTPLPPSITVHNAASPFGAISASSIAVVQINALPAPELDSSRYRLTFKSAADHVIHDVAMQPSNIFQVFAIVPPTLPLGECIVRLLLDDEPLVFAIIDIVPHGPGLFATSSNGFGPLSAHVYESTGPVLNQLTHPAVPGQSVTLWLTGLGDAGTDDVMVDIAGTLIPATYAGHHATEPGLDQVNFTLPPEAYNGCYVPTSIHILGVDSSDVESNQGTLSINHMPGACAHPLRLTYSDLVTLDNNGAVITGSVSLSSFWQPENWVTGEGRELGESVLAVLQPRNAQGIYHLAGAQAPPQTEPSCNVSPSIAVLGFGRGLAIDAGQEITLTGPSGQQLLLERRLPIYYETVGEDQHPFFEAGAWILTGSGGDNIAPFAETFALPPTLNWTNRDQLTTIPRDQDLTLTWDYRQDYLGGIARLSLTQNSPSEPGPTSLICQTPAWMGSITVPKERLQWLQPGPPVTVQLQVSPISPYRTIRFLPTPKGNVVPTVMDYTFGDSKLIGVE